MNVGNSISDGSIEYILCEQMTTKNNIDNLYWKANSSYSIGDMVFHKNLPIGQYLECKMDLLSFK